MSQILSIIQVTSAVLVIVGILLQQRGSGLSGAFGGDNSAYATRRGAERVIFVGTIIVTVIFFIASVTRLTL